MEIHRSQGCHAHFKWMKGLYISHLNDIIVHHNYDALKEYHKYYAIKTKFLYLVGTTIFLNKSATYIDLDIWNISLSHTDTKQISLRLDRRLVWKTCSLGRYSYILIFWYNNYIILNIVYLPIFRPRYCNIFLLSLCG